MPKRKSDRERSRDDEDLLDAERSPMLPGSGDAQAEAADQEIEDIIKELGSGARIKIYRISAETGAPAYVGGLPAANFTMETLAETYGGGRYMLKVFDGVDTRETVHFVEIDASIPPRNPRAPRQAAGGGVDMLMQVMAAGQASQQRSMEIMTTMMQGFATGMTAMITAMTAQRGEQRDPLAMAKDLIELTRPPAAAAQPRSLVQELRDVQAVSAMMGGGGEDSLAPIVGKGIEAIVEIAKRAPVSAPVQIPRHPVTPIPPKTPGAPVAVVEPKPPEQLMPEPRPWLIHIQPHVDSLKMAVGTMDPQTVGKMIAEQLPPHALADLVADMTAEMKTGDTISPDAVTPFAKRAAMALGIGAGSVTWLADVAFELLSEINARTPDDMTPPPGATAN